MNKYLKGARELIKANFRIYGLGNFDIYEKEIAYILELLEKEDYKSLVLFYEELERKRMG